MKTLLTFVLYAAAQAPLAERNSWESWQPGLNEYACYLTSSYNTNPERESNPVPITINISHPTSEDVPQELQAMGYEAWTNLFFVQFMDKSMFDDPQASYAQVYGDVVRAEISGITMDRVTFNDIKRFVVGADDTGKVLAQFEQGTSVVLDAKTSSGSTYSYTLTRSYFETAFAMFKVCVEEQARNKHRQEDAAKTAAPLL